MRDAIHPSESALFVSSSPASAVDGRQNSQRQVKIQRQVEDGLHSFHDVLASGEHSDVHHGAASIL
jgi:hypothetical protein